MKRSDVKQLAENGELQRQRLDSVSAAKMGNRIDEYSTIAKRGGALPTGADFKS